MVQIAEADPFTPRKQTEDAKTILKDKAMRLLAEFGYAWAYSAAEGRINELPDERCRQILAFLRL